MEGARAGAGGSLTPSVPGRHASRQPESKQPDRCEPVGLFRFRLCRVPMPSAYRCVSIMYIWTTTSGENVNGTQP